MGGKSNTNEQEQELKGAGRVMEKIKLNNNTIVTIDEDNKADAYKFISKVESGNKGKDIDSLWTRASQYVATAFQRYDRSINARKKMFPREAPLDIVSEEEAKEKLHDTYNIPQELLDKNDYNKVKAILYRYLDTIQNSPHRIPKEFLETLTKKDIEKQKTDEEARQRAEAEARQRAEAEAQARETNRLRVEKETITNMIAALDVFKQISKKEHDESVKLAKKKAHLAEEAERQRIAAEEAEKEQAKNNLMSSINININEYQKLIGNIANIITQTENELKLLTAKDATQKVLNRNIEMYSTIINNLKNVTQETYDSILKEAAKKAAEDAATISLEAYKKIFDQIKDISLITQDTLLNEQRNAEEAAVQAAVQAAAQAAAKAGLDTYKGVIDNMRLIGQQAKDSLISQQAAKDAANESLKVYIDLINKISSISIDSQLALSKQAAAKAAKITLEAYKKSIVTTQQISELLQEKLKEKQRQLYEAAQQAAQDAANKSIESYQKILADVNTLVRETQRSLKLAHDTDEAKNATIGAAVASFEAYKTTIQSTQQLSGLLQINLEKVITQNTMKDNIQEYKQVIEDLSNLLQNTTESIQFAIDKEQTETALAAAKQTSIQAVKDSIQVYQNVLRSTQNLTENINKKLAFDAAMNTLKQSINAYKVVINNINTISFQVEKKLRDKNAKDSTTTAVKTILTQLDDIIRRTVPVLSSVQLSLGIQLAKQAAKDSLDKYKKITEQTQKLLEVITRVHKNNIDTEKDAQDKISVAIHDINDRSSLEKTAATQKQLIEEDHLLKLKTLEETRAKEKEITAIAKDTLAKLNSALKNTQAETDAQSVIVSTINAVVAAANAEKAQLALLTAENEAKEGIKTPLDFIALQSTIEKANTEKNTAEKEAKSALVNIITKITEKDTVELLKSTLKTIINATQIEIDTAQVQAARRAAEERKNLSTIENAAKENLTELPEKLKLNAEIEEKEKIAVNTLTQLLKSQQEHIDKIKIEADARSAELNAKQDFKNKVLDSLQKKAVDELEIATIKNLSISKLIEIATNKKTSNEVNQNETIALQTIRNLNTDLQNKLTEIQAIESLKILLLKLEKLISNDLENTDKKYLENIISSLNTLVYNELTNGNEKGVIADIQSIFKKLNTDLENETAELISIQQLRSSLETAAKLIKQDNSNTAEKKAIDLEKEILSKLLILANDEKTAINNLNTESTNINKINKLINKLIKNLQNNTTKSTESLQPPPPQPLSPLPRSNRSVPGTDIKDHFKSKFRNILLSNPVTQFITVHGGSMKGGETRNCTPELKQATRGLLCEEGKTELTYSDIRQGLKKYHPDKNLGANKDELIERFQIINNAKDECFENNSDKTYTIPCSKPTTGPEPTPPPKPEPTPPSPTRGFSSPPAPKPTPPPESEPTPPPSPEEPGPSSPEPTPSPPPEESITDPSVSESVPKPFSSEKPNEKEFKDASEILTKVPSNIEDITSNHEKRKESMKCKLKTKHLASNILRTVIAGSFYVTTGVLSLGVAGPVLAGISTLVGNLPVAPTSVLPYAGKNTYYLGYMHSRQNCIDTTDVGDKNLKGLYANFEKYRTNKVSKFLLPKQITIGYVERGEAENSANGCFVWSLLTYEDATSVRIIIFGGGKVRAAYDAYGFVSCSLEKTTADGLEVVIIGYEAISAFAREQLLLLESDQQGGGKKINRIPVHWQDQVQYVSCGIRPSQSKWHVTVEQGKVIQVAQKISNPDKQSLVNMPEKPLIIKQAIACKVWVDGTFGDGTEQPEKQAFYKRLYKNFDFERLYLRSSKNRIEQHPEASPDNPVPNEDWKGKTNIRESVKIKVEEGKTPIKVDVSLIRKQALIDELITNLTKKQKGGGLGSFSKKKQCPQIAFTFNDTTFTPEQIAAVIYCEINPRLSFMRLNPKKFYEIQNVLVKSGLPDSVEKTLLETFKNDKILQQTPTIITIQKSVQDTLKNNEAKQMFIKIPYLINQTEWYYTPALPNNDDDPITYFAGTKYGLNNRVTQVDDTMDKKTLERLKEVTKKLNKSARKENPTKFINRLCQLSDIVNTIDFTNLQNSKTLNQKDLDDIEQNVLDTLSMIGSPFIERAEHEFEILKLNPNKVNDKYVNVDENTSDYDPSKSKDTYRDFSKKLKAVRDKMNEDKDDEKKFLSSFIKFMSLIQDLNENNRIAILEELNQELKSDGISTRFDINKINSRDRFTGGTDIKEKPTKPPIDELGDIQREIALIKKWVDNEVQAKYNFYNIRVFIPAINDIGKVSNKDTVVSSAKLNDADKLEAPVDKMNVTELYKTLVKVETEKDEQGREIAKETWDKSLIRNIGKKTKELNDIKEHLLKICELPSIKNLPPKNGKTYSKRIINAFNGDPTATSDNDQNGLIDRLNAMSKLIQSRFQESLTIIEPYASKYKNESEKYERAQKNIVEAKARGSYRFPGTGGDGGEGEIIGGDSASKPESDPVKLQIQGFTDAYNIVNSIIKEITTEFTKSNSPLLQAATSKPGLYSDILNRYTSDNYAQGSIIAAQKMEESLRANNLIPKDVLKITPTDRCVFGILTLILRGIAIQITEYLIQKGNLTNIQYSLFAFVAFYAVIFLFMVFCVNIDAYQLRIIFNYINLNINTGVIATHLCILLILTYGIYIIIHYLNFPIQAMKTIAVTDEDKAYLMYQLEVITMIIWVFLLIMIGVL